MSQPQHAANSFRSQDQAWRGDNFGHGLLALLISTILQRGLGLARNLLFCWLLLETELGIWSLAQSFLFLAAPLAVLGLPGSYARYIERYRQQGQLAKFLQQSLLLSALGSVAFVTVLLAAPDYFSRLILGHAESSTSMQAICFCLLSMILFNTSVEIAGGLRQIRLVSKMHFINSFAFTCTGLFALSLSESWQALVFAFGISHCAGAFPILYLLRCRVSMTIPVNSAQPIATSLLQTATPHKSWTMWHRLLGYAFSIWLMNLLINLFDVVDRYMLLYWLDSSIEYNQALLGQYHAARIFPLLLLSLGTMLSNLLLPYISAAWEAGEKTQVGSHVTDSLKLSALVLWCVSLGFMVLSPWIYDIGLQYRYQLGLEVQPACFLITIWSTLFLIAQNYLLCAERGRVVVIICATGLILNGILNAILIPGFELKGAVTATWLANGILLLMILIGIKNAGCQLDRTLWIALFAPLSLIAGAAYSSLVLALLLALAARTEWLITASDQRRLENVLQKYQRYIPEKLRRRGLFLPTSRTAQN